MTMPLWISLFTYLCVGLFNRFLIIQRLIKRLIKTNAGIAPSGTMGLRKPQDHSSLPAFFLCLHQCGLLKHVTCLKKMQFSKSDSAFSLWMRRESSKNINNYFGLLLTKQKHPCASVGRCQPHSAFVRAGCYCEAISEQWTQKRFQACERREDSLELANKTTPDLLPQEEGEQGPKP